MDTIRVSDIAISSTDHAAVSARIEGLKFVPKGQRLWFRFPLEWMDKISDGGEPFLAALLPVAMSLGQSLVVDAAVSEQFLDGCRRIMGLYHAWDPRLHRIRLEAPTIARHYDSSHLTGCFFTAGVDSFYSVLKNLKHEPESSKISHLIFIRGYTNCPSGNNHLFDRLYENMEACARALGCRLLVISSNLKLFIPPAAAGWDWNAGSLLAAPALCLTPQFRRIIIPSGDTYWSLSPWGSHPLVDPMWSTESLEFIHDGCEAARSQKLERYIVQSDLALTHLRVCDYDQIGVQNCGTCEKCLRTLIGLRALHVEPRHVFAQSLDLARVRALDGGDKVIGYYLRDNLELLEREDSDPELKRAIRHALRADPFRWASRNLRFAAQEFDRRLFDGRIRRWALSEAASKAQASELRLSPLRWILSHFWRSTTTPEKKVQSAQGQDSCLD